MTGKWIKYSNVPMLWSESGMSPKASCFRCLLPTLWRYFEGYWTCRKEGLAGRSGLLTVSLYGFSASLVLSPISASWSMP